MRVCKGAALTGALVMSLAARAHGQDAARRDDPEPPPRQPTMTKPPRVIEAVAPDYPEAAARAGLEAKVRVRVDIDAQGGVTRAVVVEPVGNGFDEAAVAAAEKYRFEPAEWDGVPGPIVVETTINFVLQKVEPPQPPPPAARDATGAGEPAPDGPPSHAGDPRAPITIEGVALERGIRRRLSGVIVSISQLGIDAVTDEDGRFFFHGVPPGKYDVIAVADEFDRFSRSLELERGEKLEIQLYLRPRGGNPYETVVEAEREVLEVTRRTLERQQLTSVPGTFGDPIRVIQTLPGMARTPLMTGFLLIRGSNPDDSGVFIDGHRVPLLFHFLGGPSVLNAEFLDRIDLYPGGFPARYGRSIGGIVAVETRSSKSDGVHGSADVDFLDSSGYVRVPLGEDGSLALAGRRSYLDAMLSFFLPEPDPGERLLVVPVYFDYQGRLDWSFGREGKASLFLIGSGDRLDVVSEDAAAEEFFDLNSEVDFLRVIGSYRRPIAGGLSLTLSPAYGKDGIRFSSGQFEDSEAFTRVGVSSTTLSYRMRIDGPIAEHVALDTGVDIESRVTEYSARLPLDSDIREGSDDGVAIEPEDVGRNFDALLYGLHADVGIDLGRMRLIPGVRFDGHLLAGENKLSIDPRIVARYAVSDRWTAKAYAGVFHQPPQPEATDFEFGNPDIEVERAYHVGLGAEWRFARHWMVDGEAYFVDRRNLVRLTGDAEIDQETGDVMPINFANTGVSDTIGFEVLLRREVTANMFGWLSYTFSRTRQRRDEDADYVPSAFDQRHTLNAVASYKLGSGWELGARYQLATGRPDTAVEGATYDADCNCYRPLEGEFRAIRVPTFNQLDVRAEKTWLYDTWTLGVYLDILNVLNIENEEATQFDYRFRESAPVTSVPFVPTLGVRGRW